MSTEPAETATTFRFVESLSALDLGATVSVVHQGVRVIGSLQFVNHQLDFRGHVGKTFIGIAADGWRWTREADAAWQRAEDSWNEEADRG